MDADLRPESIARLTHQLRSRPEYSATEEQHALDEIAKLPPEAMLTLSRSGLTPSQYWHQHRLDASRPR